MKQETGYLYKVLYEIAKEVNSSLAVAEVLDAIVESTAKAMNLKGCSLMLLTPDRERLIHTVAYGLSDWYVRKGPVEASPIILEALQGKPVAILNAQEDPRVLYPQQAAKEGITSMLSIPLMLRDEVIGIMRLYTTEPRHFSSEEIDFLSAVANLGAIALEKARLHESVEEDYKYRLQQKAEELSKLEKGKTRLMYFLSMVAHDLKAPLAAIQSYFGVMLGGFAGELNPKQRQMMERSSERIKGLLELISDLLDISRIETEQFVQDMKEVTLTQILEHSVEDAKTMAEQNGVKLIVNVPERPIFIYAAPDRLQQVLDNLLSNAIKFTPQGGIIGLKVMDKDNELQVEVTDTGIGIPPEDLPQIFDDFYRGSNINNPGTGLGLSIVKRILEIHRGSIWAESPCPETNSGSKFTFTLPTKKTTATVRRGEES